MLVDAAQDPTLLYLVPTPIGNLADMTHRAVSVLSTVDTILAEDTRKSGILLNHYQISKPMQSYHIHNEHHLVGKLVERLLGGETMALVSDAGTPAIADPGFLLVREARKHGVKVACLPGPTAFVPALAMAGIPASSFVFEGFLPHKKGRKTKLEQLAKEQRTVIIYESPHRLHKALGEIKTYFGGQRAISVSRELTKIYEESVSGTVDEAIDYFGQKPVKGEIVIVIDGARP